MQSFVTYFQLLGSKNKSRQLQNLSWTDNYIFLQSVIILDNTLLLLTYC